MPESISSFGVRVEDNVSKIKERLDVVDVISSYIKVQKAGMNYKARCPFHNEKTPSFYISPERQIWHCFGCQKGGDMFEFVKEIEGVEFSDALNTLAQKAGIIIERYEPVHKDEKAKLFEICEIATKFFEKQLFFSQTGQKALEYLKKRGAEVETMKQFRLGFAPNDWESLARFLKERGYNEKEIVDSGLAIKREERGTNRGVYDRFRSRIIFPIFDLNDRVVGFTGRVFEAQPQTARQQENEPAKYINTPQTLIYDKSMILYGISKAKANIRQADKCVLVEGNMDALMSYQAGVKNVVATSGTALTQNQLKLLQRYTNNLDFCFDTDQAGAIATRRGIGMALSQNLNIKVIQMRDPQCKDPADYVKIHGQKWSEVVADSKPVIEFYFEKLRSQINPSLVEGKKAVIAALAPFIKRLVSKVEKSHWVSHLALFLQSNEDAVEADINSAKDDLAIYEREPEGGDYQIAPAILAAEDGRLANINTDNILSEALLSLVIKDPNLFKDDLQNINTSFLSDNTARIITEFNADLDNFNFDSFVKRFSGEESLKLEFAYLKSQELWNGFKDEELKSEFYNLLKKLKQRAINAQLTKMELDIKDAEASRDKDKLKELMIKFTQIAQELGEGQ